MPTECEKCSFRYLCKVHDGCPDSPKKPKYDIQKQDEADLLEAYRLLDDEMKQNILYITRRLSKKE